MPLPTCAWPGCGAQADPRWFVHLPTGTALACDGHGCDGNPCRCAEQLAGRSTAINANLERAARLAENWALCHDDDAKRELAAAAMAREETLGLSRHGDPGAMHDLAAAELKGRAALLRNLAYAIRHLEA